MTENAARIILHGKQAGNEKLRAAVGALRAEGHALDVRLTWEAGDSGTLAAEAARAGIARVIAGGGDGTVNEVVGGIVESGRDAAVGIVPLGTANDFARSANIPLGLEDALRIALTAEARPVDFGRAGDRIFINVATGGFGTEITVATDPTLKKHLGGAAYLLTGLTKFAAVKPVACRLTGPEISWQGNVLVLAVGNGRQAGGGQVLCPDALVDDGLLDVAILPDIGQTPAQEAVHSLMTRGLRSIEDAVLRWRIPWVEIEAEQGLYVNLDGEPTHATHHRFDIEKAGVRMVLPPDSPLSGS